MPPLIEQIDEAANTARLQAQEFRKLAAADDDVLEAARFFGRVEALYNAVTKVLDESQTEERQRTSGH